MDPSRQGSPGGPYGRSVYIKNAVTGSERFVTHLDELAVKVGDLIRPGSIIGTVCDSAVSGKPGTTHVHLGHKA
jgi:murein DD-endopeptidase MepM/ murein hydrolase activator NlpD